MYQLVFYVPESHLEVTKQAAFAAGGGRIGDYDSCCWQTLGQGQFRPNEQAKPHIGQHNTLEQLAEYRVEMVCNNNNIKSVVQALKAAHPYEEPAYCVWRLEEL